MSLFSDDRKYGLLERDGHPDHAFTFYESMSAYISVNSDRTPSQKIPPPPTSTHSRSQHHY